MIVYKYPVIIGQENNFIFPEGSYILHVDYQADGWGNDGYVCWVLHPSKPVGEKLKNYYVGVYATGQEISEGVARYINTCVDPRGFVWHAFERLTG